MYFFIQCSAHVFSRCRFVKQKEITFVWDMSSCGPFLWTIFNNCQHNTFLHLAVFWHFISELFILERADVKGKTPCLTLSWYINVVLHVNVDLSFLFSFRTSGPYQTSHVRNYTSHVSHSRVGQGCAWREMESISCIKYNKQNSVTTRQWNKEIDQIIAVVLNYKIHCT